MKHSINLEPADEALDGRQLDRLIQLWLDHCERRSDLAPATVVGYRNRIIYFREWWQDVGPWCNWELTREKFAQFGDWLNGAQSQYRKPLEFNSRKDVYRRLRQCFKWAFERDYLSRDIRPWLPKVAGSAPLRQRAELDDLAALMLAAGRSGCPVRDQALIALLLGTGLRKMEAASLDVEDVRMYADLSGKATVRQAKRVRGRTVQGRVVAFDEWTGHYVGKLLDSYAEATGPLFRTAEGTRRVGSQAAYRIVKRAIARAGLSDRIEGPHDLRRNFATWFAKQNRGELHGRLLSKQLGHSRFMQTDEYVLHDADDLVGVIRSPLAGQPYIAPETNPAKKRRSRGMQS